MAILLKDIPNAKEILERLKYSGAEQTVILNCIKHSTKSLTSKIELKQFLSKLNIPFDILSYIYAMSIDNKITQEYNNDLHNYRMKYKMQRALPTKASCDRR